MKKIPSLFIREFENHIIRNITTQVTPGCEWVLNGEGIATEKFDGTCCLIQDGKLYKRYDAKKGKIPPKGAIPCQPEADPITGHWPHWVLVSKDKPEDKWYVKAYDYLGEQSMLYDKYIIDGTYELCGPHFQGNPYNLERDLFFRHGEKVLKDVPRDFEGIKKYLEEHYIEGIVFHRGNGDMCKIKRTDFNLEWNNSNNKRK